MEKGEKAIFWIILLSMWTMWSLSSMCTKERSCEGPGCGGSARDTVVVVDTIPNDTIRDTIVSNMIAYYDIVITDNKDVKVIYPIYTSKYHPATYRIMDSLKLKLDTTKSSRYRGMIDLRAHLPPNEIYKKGDIFMFKMEIRYRFGNIRYTNSTTLTY